MRYHVVIKHKIIFKITFYYKVSLYAIKLNKFLFILLSKKKMKTTTGGYIRYFKEFILNLKVFDYIWFL